MTRFFILLTLLTALLLPSAVLVAPSAQAPQTALVATDTLNVRAGPSTASALVGQAKRGDALPVIDRNIAGTWLRIRLPNGKEGWVSAALVRLALAPTPATLAPAASKATSPIPAGAIPAQLVDVVDGDTIKVSVNGVTEALRYIGMDTPERGQPGFGAATSANRALLTPTLYLVADHSDRDQYGRLLRYVYTDAGLLVNAELVRKGWAQPVEYPPDTARAAEFRSLAGEAARAKRGFWSGAASDGAMPYAVTQRSANVRKGPGTGFATTTTLPAGTPLTVFGRTPAGDWLQVRAPDRKGGWVSVGLVALAVAVDRVAVASEIPAAPAAADAAAAERIGVVAAPGGVGAVQIVDLQPSGDDEVVVVQNAGGAAVDLGGWWLQSFGGKTCAPVPEQVFRFPAGFVLAPGASVRIHSGPGAFDAAPGDLLWSKDNVWNNGGDRAELHQADGQVVSSSGYGGCR